MTIFAWDGKTLVADRAEYKYGVIVNDNAEKTRLFQVGNVKVAIAGAGGVPNYLAIVDFIKNDLWRFDEIDVHNYAISDKEGYLQLFSGIKDDEYDIIVVLSDDISGEQQAYYLGTQPFPLKVNAPYAGGHSDAVLLAMGAMLAGVDAVGAVKLAVRASAIAQSDRPLSIVKV